MVEVTDNPARSRYELHIDGELVGVADYRLENGVVVIPHTEIQRDRRGQGWGAVLVRGMLDDVRAQRRTVVARCWFVADFIEQNSSYADLLAA